MLIKKTPDAALFKELSEHYNVIPVFAEVLADTETPVSLLKKFFYDGLLSPAEKKVVWVDPPPLNCFKTPTPTRYKIPHKNWLQFTLLFDTKARTTLDYFTF